MGFSRPEYDEDKIQWNRIRARLEDDDEGEEQQELTGPGMSADADNEDGEENPAETAAGQDGRRRPATRPSRGAGSKARRALKPLPRLASPEIAEERLPKIKAAAQRMKKLKKVAVDPEKRYRVGQKVFDPMVQKFGKVVLAAPGYVRIEMRDGTQTAHGKPPLDDRKNFVLANFDHMDNKTMAEILEISVHTMRRLCHDYGLKRHGKKKAARRKAASA